MKMKTADVLPYFENNARLLGAFFSPRISRQAVKSWGEYIPELRVRQLVEKLPMLKKHVEDEDGLTPAARAALASAASSSEAMTSRG